MSQPLREPMPSIGRLTVPRLLLESAIFLSVATAVLYYIGYAYAAFYFGRLALPQSALDLPLSFYLGRAVVPVLSIGAIVLLVAVVPPAEPRSFWRALAGNAAPIGCLALVAINGAEISGSDEWGLWALPAVLIAVFVLASYTSRRSVHWHAHQGDRAAMAVLLLIALLASLVFAAGRGQRAAEEVVEGERGGISVEFQFADPAKTIGSGKPLLLVMMRNDSYFVIERESPAPARPRLYVVPRDEVVSATLQRIED